MDVRKMIIYRQIGAKIAYYRTLRGMTQEELAERIHVSKSTLGRIERGKYNQNVSVSILLDVAEGLRIDMSLLVTFSEQDKKIWWDLDGGDMIFNKNGGSDSEH